MGVSFLPQGAQDSQGSQQAHGFPLHPALGLFNMGWFAARSTQGTIPTAPNKAASTSLSIPVLPSTSRGSVSLEAR